MFETTSVPEGWVRTINKHLDEIWVPSKFAKSVFLKEGVKVPIVVIKEGFDPEVFSSKNATSDKSKFFNHCKKDFVFLSASKWEDRKGWDVLLQAFTEEFTGIDRVCLAIRSTGLKDQLNHQNNPNHARILKIDKIAMNDYPSLFKSADAFILPSHGEGWGRTAMEALAMGLPTIASRWSGLGEFIAPEYSIPINITDVEYAFANEPGNLGGKQFAHKHSWARLDKYAVRAALRWVYNNQLEAAKIGERAEQFMNTYYTREVIAEDIHKRLLQIYHMKFRTRNLQNSEDHNLLHSKEGPILKEGT